MASRPSIGVRLLQWLYFVVVVLIVSVLMGWMPGLFIVDRPGPAKRAAAKLEIVDLLFALERYRKELGNYPGELSALRPYLSKAVPLDPWGRAFQYKYPGDHGEGPDVMSLGADGQEGGEGIDADIVMWP